MLAISKTKSAELIRIAYQQGQTAFGENYAQEILEKAPLLADLPIEWHFVGPIQSNKTATIATYCDWVHSVDRLKIARRLSEQRPPGKDPLNVLIQVNISGESSKSGVTPEALPDLAESVSLLPGILLRGLMAIPAPQRPDASPRAAFSALRELKEETGVDAELIGLIDVIDTVREDEDGRIQFHYTLVDFAAIWTAGEPVADDDVSDAEWAPLSEIEERGLWSETIRVIREAVKMREERDR